MAFMCILRHDTDSISREAAAAGQRSATAGLASSWHRKAQASRQEAASWERSERPGANRGSGAR